MFPTIKTCFSLMEEYERLPHIREHSIVVAKVAEILSKEAQRNGAPLNVELTVAGALLHDIAKTQCLGDKDGSHARMGREICLSHGYVRVADIVAEHVVLKNKGNGPVTEKEIVYYSDKRVNHDQIVSLEERLTYIKETYAANNRARQELIHINFQKCIQLEKRIFQELPFAPDQVAGLVEIKEDWQI